MDEMKTTKEIKKFYTKRAKLYDLVLVNLFRYGKGLANFLEKSDYLKPNLRILDAGCGSGALTKPLYNQSIEKNLENISFHGFDITPAMLDLFKKWINKNNAENIELVQADVLKLEKLGIIMI